MTMKAKIISSKVIKPQIPTPLYLKNYKISFLDQLTASIHAGMIFFFPASDFKSSTDSTSKKCDQLEKSLSETLTHYYPLAGRFIRDDFVVDCGDQGVEVSRARVNGEIAEIIHGRPETKLLDNFVPSQSDLARSIPWPVSAVQINIFDCGGTAIGIRILHNIGDGISGLGFVKEWATRNRTGGGVNENEEPIVCPSFELGSLFPARKLVGLKPVAPANFPPNKLITKSFVFDGGRISALKAEARPSDSGNPAEGKPSRVQVVTTHIWRILIQIARAKHGHFKPSLMSFALSLRGRTHLQIPENSFGTLVGHTTVRYNADGSEMELNDLVALLRNAISKTSNDYAKVRHGDEIYSMLIDYYNEIGGDKPREVDLCRFTSWCGFSCYGIDFGWGNPSWVATLSKAVEMVFLLDTKCSEGIEAWVTLNKEDMVEFERRYLDHGKPSTVEIYSKL